jgi:hypothetical protein
MDESKRREVVQWIAKAGRDLRSARRLFSDAPPLFDTWHWIPASCRNDGHGRDT